ncbi:scavenger mRNA decapping enzyme [Irpex rosettiformis]|uniref:Scavenger mRNA decapping enzyme n=1 Tax=Irpex rosettiformis TaxID=378272 RepID=A0ACB8U2H1_9APHY|nr:scavenger mRNA decapping enzyme [Irpex rosettiformis]
MQDLELLRHFQFERILNEDPLAHSLTLLGSVTDSDDLNNSLPAIIRIEKTALPISVAPTVIAERLQEVKPIESTDIYTWMLGWLKASPEHPDVKINIIYPATEVHIRKYTTQTITMVQETPGIYASVVKPYIDAFPPSRIQWVLDILSGKSEAEKVLYRSLTPENGFIILPDMKWDLTTVSSLYLVAIALTDSVRSLRDLRKAHLPMLRTIREEATRIVGDKWGLAKGSLRLYVHYQPSYYHFHVHIVNAGYYGLMGSTVGQAHLLEDIISLLELDPDEGPSIFERMTLTYGLGDQHGLYDPLIRARV